jgi:hypothetical protein
MDRLKGLGSFVVIAVVIFAGLRGLHVVVPLFVPNARPGPFTPAGLEDVSRYAGFAPVVPAYRPASLGDRPASLTVWLSPRPTFAITWTGEHSLSLIQRQGGSMPDHPPTSQPLSGVPESQWWQDGPRCHLVLKHREFWIEITTDLEPRELRRFADTLTRQ